jgi:hypothetical protein
MFTGFTIVDVVPLTSGSVLKSREAVPPFRLSSLLQDDRMAKPHEVRVYQFHADAYVINMAVF